MGHLPANCERQARLRAPSAPAADMTRLRPYRLRCCGAGAAHRSPAAEAALLPPTSPCETRRGAEAMRRAPGGGTAEGMEAHACATAPWITDTRG